MATPATSTPGTNRSSARPTVASTASASQAARRDLTECQAKVRAADKVLETAKTGVQDWTKHVQAQTDANSKKITVREMEGEFTQTRLAGPADQKRSADAVSAYGKQNGSCTAVENAQAVWLRAWRAAPKNIDAYAEAAADFDAPRC